MNTHISGSAGGIGRLGPAASIEAVDAAAHSGRGTPTVYIVDEFGRPTINLNRSDTYADVSHGDLVGLTYRAVSGRDFVPVHVEHGIGSPDYDAAILNLASRVALDHPDGDLGDVVVNLSWHTEGLGPLASDALKGLIEGGATVYVAGGNARLGPNPLSELDGVVTVGGNDGAVGEPDSGVPIAAFPRNAESDVYANAVVRATPVADANGRFAGVDIDQDGRVDVPAAVFENASPEAGRRERTVAEYSGRPVADRAVSYEEMMTYFEALANDPDGTLPNTMAGKVIELGELIDNDALGELEPPPGIDPSDVYVSVEDAGGSPEFVTFFETDERGSLRRLSEFGPGVEVRGTSYAAPNAAALETLAGTRSRDRD